MSRLRIRYCGVLEQVCGATERDLEVPQLPVKVHEVLAQIGAENPEARIYLPAVACAIGDAIVSREQSVGVGQTLVLLPPVSGG